MRLLFSSLFLLLLFACNNSNLKPSPEHEQALASMEIMDGFSIELVAHEPLVADPVAMEIDENGRLFVVEMHGYPLDLSQSGLVKQLIDTDGDGLPDESVIFADSLTLPTGIMRWKKGFLVTDAPDVIYLEDTDDDGQADKREVILTGFALSNPQHNLNTPRFELDNWIYLGHESAVTPFVHKETFGDRGEVIRFPQNPNAPQLGRNANGKMVRFKPDSYELEALSGDTQFGYTLDPWGHRIYTSNARHLYHEVLAAPYQELNPNLLVERAVQSIPDHGDAAKVFPITENPNHQLLTDVGVITSSCGVTWYKGGAFGKNFENVTFIAEPTHNLVHADVIEEKGASFLAKRLLENQDFLASRDPWFRPVNFYTGPDGALYVLDYYRQIIEHPEWMSDEVNQSGALYHGSDKGRIYRVVPKDGLSMNWLDNLDLDETSLTELVRLLDHSNIWYRRTAQRLLFQRQSQDVIPALKNLLSDAQYPEAKVPALWLLNDLNGLRGADILAGLKDAEAGVRENAIRVLEANLDLLEDEPSLLSALLQLQDDPSAKVRFQLLCTSAFIQRPEVAAARMAILSRDIEDPWVSIAAIAASAGQEAPFLEMAQQQFADTYSSAKAEFFAHLGSTIANSGHQEAFAKMLRADDAAWWKTAAFSGIRKLWRYREPQVEVGEREKEQLLQSFHPDSPAEWRKVAVDLLEITGLPKGSLRQQKIADAQVMIQNNDLVESLRTDALRLLALSGSPAFKKMLPEILESDQSELLQVTALQSLRGDADDETCDFLLENFAQFKPKAREACVQVFMSKRDHIHKLLDAVSSQQIKKEELGWRRTVSLMNYYDTEVREHARQVLSVSEDRKAVLQKYLAAIELEGAPAQGKILFEEFCTTCHQADGVEGVDFGPNLSTLRSRNSHSIITEIIHPNNSIADQYENWEIKLKNGTLLTGIVEQENQQTLVLKQMTGERTVLQTSEVESMQKMAFSAMPNGLESSISVEDMADLVAFIKGR